MKSIDLSKTTCHYPGTLNIQTDKDLHIPSSAIYIEDARLNQGVNFIPARFMDEEVFIVRPEISDHPDNILEIVAKHPLKDKYNLSDGDEVEVVVLSA